MADSERRLWQSTIDGAGLRAADRRSGHYETYLPDVLKGREFLLPGDVAADVADATAAICRLDARAAALTNTEALARLLLRAESIASSQIEGLHVSAQRLLRADVGRIAGKTSSSDATATEVLANIDAMSYAIEDANAPVTSKRLLEVHRRLLAPTRLAAHGGVIRSTQNWIGGSAFNPIGARFVPPSPEHVRPLIDDLCEFCNEDQIPAVAQAALAHAQFETIHPFVDGNGRTGRALIYMVLRRRGLARRAIPPISLVLATRADAYVRALTATRYLGPPSDRTAMTALNEWIAFFSDACVRAVRDAESFEDRVIALQAEWRMRLGDVRSDASSLKLVDALPAMPVITVKGASSVLGRSFAAANRAIEELVAAGILTGGRAQRNRIFEARELIDAFTSLERQLASPSGDTRAARPSRTVPDRPRR